MASIRIHVNGLDALIRQFDRLQDGVEEALDDGCEEAAEYLQECIEDKFGTYQPRWKKLKYETIAKERKMGFGTNASKPLVMSGDAMFSFYREISNRTRKHTVTIKTDDEKIAYHVYGVPSANVPKRDPIRPTVKEEREKCLDIIKSHVKKVLKRG